jgi:uncharacterized phage-associated protein
MFAAQAGASIDKLKLIKLIYLAEREFISRYAMPMLFDEYYSLPHGPICSSTLNAINGETADTEAWAKLIALSGSKDVSAVHAVSRDDLDEISDAEWEVLLYTWHSFGHLTASQIRNYTHKNCPEYVEVERGRLPIRLIDMLEALGIENAHQVEAHISAARRIDVLLSL